MSGIYPKGFVKATGVKETSRTCQDPDCGRTFRVTSQSQTRCPHCGSDQTVQASAGKSG